MSTIFWLIGTFGLGGAILVGAILVFGWPVIVGTKLGRTLLAIGGAILFVITTYLKGRAEGEKVAKMNQEKANADFILEQERYRNSLDQLSDADLDRLLTDHRSQGGK